jgi:hypothetical protein
MSNCVDQQCLREASGITLLKNELAAPNRLTAYQSDFSSPYFLVGVGVFGDTFTATAEATKQCVFRIGALTYVIEHL